MSVSSPRARPHSITLWNVTGVIQSVVGEITDSTNRARGFGLIFVLWAVGGSLG